MSIDPFRRCLTKGVLMALCNSSETDQASAISVYMQWRAIHFSLTSASETWQASFSIASAVGCRPSRLNVQKGEPCYVIGIERRRSRGPAHSLHYHEHGISYPSCLVQRTTLVRAAGNFRDLRPGAEQGGRLACGRCVRFCLPFRNSEGDCWGNDRVARHDVPRVRRFGHGRGRGEFRSRIRQRCRFSDHRHRADFSASAA